MAYITYFDLLGTKGFCENSEVYYKNIQTFYEIVHKASFLLNEYGKVGIFSDCVYAESTDLRYLLDFLAITRERLMAKGLYFNAVIKEGKLGIKYISDDKHYPSFGICLEDSSIADLYISQTKFKGVGIFIDPSIVAYIQEVNETAERDGTPEKKFAYEINDCIYISKTSDSYAPHPYKDIALPPARYNKSILQSLAVLFNTLYGAYIKSPRYGLYYISVISNMLRSYSQELKWDLTKKDDFMNQPLPLIFKAVKKILDMSANELSGLDGIEYLALVMLDIVYKSHDLDEEKKRSFTKKIADINCVKKHFIHQLNNIPDGIFTVDKKLNINNKNLFIRYCQEDLSDEFVNNVLDFR